MNKNKYIAAQLSIAALFTATIHAQEIADELDPIVVTGTRSERKLSEVPVRTEVIGREEIQKTQSRTLADAIEWTNGIRVENDCQNCNFQQVRMLGLPGNFTQILADGRPSLSSLAAVYGIEQIPPRSSTASRLSKAVALHYTALELSLV
jgi:outer membrane receptor for ferrienterochelin and colicins